ncbi:MAG: hypothetical protein ACRCSG_04315 [Cellulosilyticaceae bacterium]
MKQNDFIAINNGIVELCDVEGVVTPLPNLTKMVELYKKVDNEEVKKNIKNILSEPVESLLVSEIMIDMQNEKAIERLYTGEISKTMHHVHTYFVILSSHMTKAKEKFAKMIIDGESGKNIESIYFAPFPYGMVIESAKFPEFKNDEAENRIVL